jgi:hypothetical protein
MHLNGNGNGAAGDRPEKSQLAWFLTVKRLRAPDGSVEPAAEDGLAFALKTWGAPDVKESNENDDPRPQSVITKLTYRRKRIEVMFVSNAAPPAD